MVKFRVASMAKKVFVSYSKKDIEVVEELLIALTNLGFHPWLDRDMNCGEEWWNKILANIRECQLLIACISNDFLASDACKKEIDYAFSLGKTILPVVVRKTIQPLPSQLAVIQWVDYSLPSLNSISHLARSLFSASPSPHLPNPLPQPPQVPLSKLSQLCDILKADYLTDEEQKALFFELSRLLENSDTMKGAEELLGQLRVRDDLRAAIGDKIDQLFNQFNLNMALDHSTSGRNARQETHRGSSLSRSSQESLKINKEVEEASHNDDTANSIATWSILGSLLLIVLSGGNPGAIFFGGIAIAVSLIHFIFPNFFR